MSKFNEPTSNNETYNHVESMNRVKKAFEVEMQSQAKAQQQSEQLIAFTKLVAAKTTAKEREACTEAAMKAAEKAINVAIALEREACAKVCDEFNFGQSPMMIQRAIRARGEA